MTDSPNRFLVDVDHIAEMLEGALTGADPKRRIWTDADYLCAALAAITGDGDRARAALLAYLERLPDRPYDHGVWEHFPVRFHRQWRSPGWAGRGWNALHLGFATVWFPSGLSPRERLRGWLRAR